MTVLADYFLVIKTIHVIAAFAWMAGLLYLPRLFAYHADVAPRSEAAQTFKVMERRLLRAIMTPAMVVTVVFGGLAVGGLGAADDAAMLPPWLWIKLAAVAGLLALHMAMARWRRDFANDANRRTPRFYKIVNEVPAVLLVVIVAMVVMKPF